MRCNQHGLAVGPGGECVLCLRATRDRNHTLRSRTPWLLVGFVGVALASCGASLFAHSLRAADATEPLSTARFTTAAATPSAVHTVDVEAAAVALPAVDQAENKPDPSLARSVPAASAISSELVPSPSVEGKPSARAPSSRELLAALHATPVSMFSTTWCRHCERARRFFRANGVSVVERDIDADARAAAELVRRSGGKAVPLIDVDGRELRGFDERATIDAVVASVERRLGVTGLKLSVASVSERGG